MIEIRTYLDGDENENMPYQEFTGTLSEELDGAIEIVIDGKMLFRYENEFINVNWTGIIYEMLMLLDKEGRTIKDAPLLEDSACISLRPIGSNMLKVVHPYSETEVLMDDEGLPYHRVIEEGEKVAIVNKDEFMKALAVEGWKYFKKMADLLPDRKKDYECEQLKWIEGIFKVLGVDRNSL